MPKTDFLMNFFLLLMNFFGKVEKRGSINERLHFFAKDEKGYPFYQFVLVGTRRKRVSFFFINFDVTREDWQMC